jgi:hypothetical protein
MKDGEAFAVSLVQCVEIYPCLWNVLLKERSKIEATPRVEGCVKDSGQFLMYTLEEA